VIGVEDPDPRTAGAGLERTRAAGSRPSWPTTTPAARACGLSRARTLGRPHVTLKLAVTADGFIARADGTSKWITGEPARAHVHRERARCDAILVGGARCAPTRRGSTCGCPGSRSAARRGWC
jgi:diaminohydroxyphosphoribosylaminopyrimidine deaminase/5-amino-6-(5-phosphoribosylamino)uracil reductase